MYLYKGGRVRLDTIFSNLGIYDFLGVWAPGAIFLSYCTLTFSDIVEKVYMKLPFSDLINSVIMYIGIAYVIGVLFHEIGKWVVDKITYFFDLEQYRNTELLKLKPKVKWVPTPRRLQYGYKKIIDECEVNPNAPFNYVYSKLKYDKDVDRKRINTYHAIYGLSRDLFIASFTHLILSIIFMCFFGADKLTIFVILVDLVLAYLFFCRMVRYFTNWVKNVYFQYNYLFGNTENNYYNEK